MDKLQLKTEIEKALTKAFYLSLKINRDTDLCVFVDMAGHVDNIRFRLPRNKKQYSTPEIVREIDYETTSEYSWKKDCKERLDYINELVEFLEKTLEDKGIDYSELYPVYEQVIKCYEL